MQRLDPNRVVIPTPQIAITLFANEAVHIDRASVVEIEDFAKILDTIDQLKRAGFLDPAAAIERIILTPDFHKGAGIPIGTVFFAQGLVIPRAVGSDIGCGMRFLTTDVTRAEFETLGSRLDQIIRHIFFEGGRNIPLSRQQRERIFCGGLPGLLETDHSPDGIFEYWDKSSQQSDCERVHHHGVFPARQLFELQDFIIGSGTKYTHDDQIGSIGGGNHFVELQIIEEVFDRHKAYEWGIKPGSLAIMVHSGSVGIGHRVGNHFTDIARHLYPKHLRHTHQHYVIPEGNILREYIEAMSNAANFAFANRLFLGLMMVRALSEATGRHIDAHLVYDAPHNLIWQGHGYLHRKGACPAEYNQPVIIPGSMGSDSFLMTGLANFDSFCSACHGAGRIRSRQQSRKVGDIGCRVVTKMDPTRVRRDIRDDFTRSLLEEAPDRYKPITPVIETIEGAGIAQRVARTFPLLTVKGL